MSPSSASLPTTRVDDSLRLTAFHEAGHAVMAQLCGQQITVVEIVGDEDHMGSVSSLRFTGERPGKDDPALPTAPIERRLLCTVAGMAAESLASGEDRWDESCEDLNVAVGLAMRVVGDCERLVPFLEDVREHTNDLLRRNWVAVDTLASLLIERRSLRGDEVRRVLAPLLPE